MTTLSAFLDELFGIDLADIHLEFAGLYPQQVKVLVDHETHPLAFGIYRTDELLARFGVDVVIIEENLGIGADGSERGAQLMGNVGEEPAFVLVGFLQLTIHLREGVESSLQVRGPVLEVLAQTVES